MSGITPVRPNLGRQAAALAVDAHTSSGRVHEALALGWATAHDRHQARGSVADAIGHLHQLRSVLDEWDRLAIEAEAEGRR